jgi:hypothetical protein
MDQADHLVGPHSPGRVLLAQPFADVGSCCPYAQERQRPSLCGPRQRSHHRHHDPAKTGTAHRAFCAGKCALAVMASCADCAAPASLKRVIDDQVHARSWWDNGLHDEKKHLATHGQRRPACSGEDLMEEAPGARLVMAAGAQGGCDGAAPSGEQRSASHDHPFPPCWSRTQRSKDGQNVSNRGGKGHECPPSKMLL